MGILQPIFSIQLAGNHHVLVNFAQDFAVMEGAYRVKVAVKLMEFVVPKLQRTTVEDTTERKR